MQSYWSDYLASRRITDPAERALADVALRKLREGWIADAAQSLALALVQREGADRAWQTWFWFNHFNVLPQKSHIGVVLQSYLSDAIGASLDLRFADLLQAVTVHPAMLMYLDNVNNTRRTGNENQARELLELHSLGVSGGYSQQDVAAASRVLSGWTVQLAGDPQAMGRTVFRPDQHDAGAQRVAGLVVPAGGAEQLPLLLAHLGGHAATARHVAQRLCVWWLGEPVPQAVDALVAVFERTGGSLPALWDAARQLRARWPAPALFKDPMRFVSSAVLAVCGDVPVVNAQPVLRWLRALGQPLLGRSTPEGYPLQGRFWLSSGQLAQRVELARDVVSNAARLTTPTTFLPDGTAAPLPRFALKDLRTTASGQQWLARHPSALTALASSGPGSVNPYELWALYLASPEFMFEPGLASVSQRDGGRVHA